jgi:hypothetical protein
MTAIDASEFMGPSSVANGGDFDSSAPPPVAWQTSANIVATASR